MTEQIESNTVAKHRFGSLTEVVRDTLSKNMSADAAFFFARAPQLEQQRDELLAALERVRDRLEGSGYCMGGDIAAIVEPAVAKARA